MKCDLINTATRTFHLFTMLSPGQTIATFQRNISQHCWIILRHVAEGLAKPTQHHAKVYAIVSANIYGP